MNTRRTFLAAAAALAAAACGKSGSNAGSGPGATGAPGGGADAPATVRVIHVPSTLFAPLYVADARGYFKEKGLTLDLQTVKSGQDAIPLTASGKADVLVAGFGSGLFSAANQKLQFKVVGSMGAGGGDKDNSPTALMVSAKLAASEIKSPADLKGRKIALSGGPGGAGGYQLASIITPAGLTLKDIKAVSLGFPDMENAIKNGSVDAALPPAPFTTAMIEHGTATQFALPPKGTIASGVIYSEDFIKNKAAQPFFDALVKASRDLQKDPKEKTILEILAKATSQDVKVLEANPSYVWLPDLAPVTEQLDKQQEAYAKAGLFDFNQPVPTAQFVNDSFAKKAPKA